MHNEKSDLGETDIHKALNVQMEKANNLLNELT